MQVGTKVVLQVLGGKKEHPASCPSGPLMIQFCSCDHKEVLKDSIDVDLTHNKDNVVHALVLVGLTCGAAHLHGRVQRKRLSFHRSQWDTCPGLYGNSPPYLAVNWCLEGSSSHRVDKLSDLLLLDCECWSS